MTELCERYEISRKTGYKWLERYALFGPAGLMERPRAPLVHGRATPEHIVDAIEGLRRKRPSWGPRKIMSKLEARQPDDRLAGGLDGGRDPEACGAGLRPTASAAWAAAHGPTDGAAACQPRVGHGSQGLGTAGRWLAHRTVDDDGRVQPLSDQRDGDRQHRAICRVQAAVRAGFPGDMACRR